MFIKVLSLGAWLGILGQKNVMRRFASDVDPWILYSKAVVVAYDPLERIQKREKTHGVAIR
jgi:hypothetical protein